MRFPLPADFRSRSQLPIKVALADSDRQLFKDFNRSTFIYIRNLGLKTQDLDLSFDGLSYDEKCEFMLKYLFGDINCEIKELDETWTKSMRIKMSCDMQELQSIFNSAELQKFVIQHEDQIVEAMRNIKTGAYQAIDLQKRCNTFSAFPTNMFNMLKTYGNFLEFIPWNAQLKFTDYNISSSQQSLICTSLKSVVLLYGQKTQLWNEFQKRLSQLMGVQSKQDRDGCHIYI